MTSGSDLRTSVVVTIAVSISLVIIALFLVADRLKVGDRIQTLENHDRQVRQLLRLGQ